MPPGLSLVAITKMRLELEDIERQHHRRAAESDRSDLLERARAALRDSNAMKIDDFIVVAGTRLAMLLVDMGRPEAACESVGALRLMLSPNARKRFRVHPLGIALGQQYARALGALARAEADPEGARRRWSQVDEQASAVIDVVESHRNKINVPNLASAYTRFSIQLYELAVEARFELGDPIGALERAELVKCRSIQRLQNGKVSSVGDGELQNEFRKLCAEIDDVAAEGATVDQLVARRRAIWDLLAMRRRAEGTQAHGFSMERLQAALPEETAVVYWFWLGGDRLLVAAVDSSEVAVTVERVCDRLIEAIRRKAEGTLAFDPRRSSKNLVKPPLGLADALFPPQVRSLLEAQSRLVLSPHRSLHAVPIHALTWGPRTPLLCRFAVSYVPNLTTLMRPLPPRRERRALFVGVPHRAKGTASRRLDGAIREGIALRRHYGESLVTPLLAPEGTERELNEMNERGQLEEFDVLHFSCHGTNVDSDNPMESRLLLYDSELDGLDIANWRLRADVVVLSACSSGQRPVSGRGLKELPGDELFGLTAAFFVAGAGQVLGTLWPAEDDVAAFICPEFHREWHDQPADVALHKLVKAYLRDRPGDLGAPYYWAPYFLTVSGMPAPCPMGRMNDER